MQKFYATFKETKGDEIAEFTTEQQRDDWVNFRDEFSKAFDVTSDNAAFQRISLTEGEAQNHIGKCQYTYPDNYNSNQIWYSQIG